MSIRVECPYGHIFKVKEKYAGKKGLCPQCEGQVVVRVPSMTGQQEMSDAGWKSSRKPYSVEEDDAELVYDAPADGSDNTSDTGQSLVGASAVRHNKQCAKCGHKSPIWYASCPKCNKFFADM